MLNTRRIAIVIPTLNAGLYLSECLTSIINTLPTDYCSIPILILDGGSHDTTHAIVLYYANIYNAIDLHVANGSHPAFRINSLIQSGEYDYLLMCHADDLYNMHSRLVCLGECINRGDIIRGSQVAYFESPLDKCKNFRASVYSGVHTSHPLDPVQITLELCHWWAVSLNTVSINARALRELGLQYDWEAYSHAADYYLNWEVAKMGLISNSAEITTLTRHNSFGDGPLNREHLQDDFSCIRSAIVSEIGIADLLGADLRESLLNTYYSYGKFLRNGDIGWIERKQIKNRLRGHVFKAGDHRILLSDLPLPSTSGYMRDHIYSVRQIVKAQLGRLLVRS